MAQLHELAAIKVPGSQHITPPVLIRMNFLPRHDIDILPMPYLDSCGLILRGCISVFFFFFFRFYLIIPLRDS